MLTIVITHPLEEEYIEQIKMVSPDINVMDASPFYSSGLHENPAFRSKLDTMLIQADVICGYWPPKDVISRSPHLKWIHSMLAGVDRPEWSDLMLSPILITNSRGIHGIQVSELVFELMLMLAKRAPFCFKKQQEKKWVRFVPQLIHEKTLGIVGLGNIGKAIARMAKSFDMRVVATDRYVKQVTRIRNVDRLIPSDQLLELLSGSDFVVLALPLTPETTKLIGEKELRSMKATAYLINISRGSIIDEDTLIRALEEHWIAGAGLDTVTAEPLSPQSKLWELPNVIITPHIAGQREDYDELAISLFCDNLRRYLRGKKLRNIVDKKKGF